jgi:16S rRNA (guanine527-N7)-methyltransferase
VSMPEILESELRNAGLNLSPAKQQQLATYAAEIEHWNHAVNLSALRGTALVRRLIVEPIRIGTQLGLSGVLADVGSGNGSPGIPLSVACDFRAVHLIEPRLKRVSFLRNVVAKLGLKDVVVHRSRIEDMADGAMSCDWISLQAIDPTVDIVRALRRISMPTTRVVWITSRTLPPIDSAVKIEGPDKIISGWSFRLDQT